MLLSFTLCSCNIDYKKIYEVDNDLAELDLTNYWVQLTLFHAKTMKQILMSRQKQM